MKTLITIIAAVLVVGCGESQQSPTVEPAEPAVEAAKTEPPTAEAPDISINKAATFGNIESIHKAAEIGNIRAVKQHLATGVDVNDIDANKMTALHWAAMKGQKKVVALLIVKGANLNAKTSKNLTPLNLADNNFENEIAELLIANGASEFVY